MIKLYVLIFIALSLDSFIFADRILLNNGQTIKGRIREKTDQRVTIESSAGSFSLRLSEVKRIEEDSPIQNSLIDVDIFLAKKNAHGALDAYRNALSQGLPFSQFIPLFLNQHSRWEACFDEISGVQKNLVGKKIIETLKDAGMRHSSDALTTDTLDFRFAIARILTKTGHGHDAAEMFSSLPNEFYQSFPEKRIFAVKFLKSEVAAKTNRGEFDEAIATLENLESLDQGEERKSRILVFLRWGARLRDQGQWSESALIYGNRVAPLSREIAANRLKFLFEKMEREAHDEAGYEELIELMKEYSALVSALPELASGTKNLENLYRKAGEIALENDNAIKALALFREGFLTSNRKNATLFDLYQYAQTLISLEPEDYIGNYELGVFCREKGLFDKAEKHFRVSFTDSSLKPSAQREIELMRKRRHLDTLKDAVAFYDAKDYVGAMDALQLIYDDEPSTVVLRELASLDELCRKELENESNKRPLRALIQYQQAERRFLLEEYDDALSRLDYVLQTYADTPIAPKARELMIAVLRRREIARLESSSKTREDFRKRDIRDQSAINAEIKKLMDSLDDE